MKPKTLKTVHTIGDLPDTRTGADPLQVNARLYMQISELLNQLESGDGERITLRERIAALVAIGRIQVLFVGLRKEVPGGYASDAGSSVRKYSTAFAKDDTGRRKKIAGPRPAEPDPNWFERAGVVDDSDDDSD
jgi:hypothetical protein